MPSSAIEQYRPSWIITSIIGASPILRARPQPERVRRAGHRVEPADQHGRRLFGPDHRRRHRHRAHGRQADVVQRDPRHLALRRRPAAPLGGPGSDRSRPAARSPRRCSRARGSVRSSAARTACAPSSTASTFASAPLKLADRRSRPGRNHHAVIHRRYRRIMRRPLKLTQLMLFSRREPVSRTPAEVGLEYEHVAFKASDGVGIKGWFIPADGTGPEPRDRVRARLDVEPARQRRRARAARRPRRRLPARDQGAARRGLQRAAVRHPQARRERERQRAAVLRPAGEARLHRRRELPARPRTDVDGERIGSLGISMGGTIALYGAPECQPIKSILAVPAGQASRSSTTTSRCDQFGPFGPAIVSPIELLYRIAQHAAAERAGPGRAGQAPGRDDRQLRAGHGRPLGHDGGRPRFADGTPTLTGRSCTTPRPAATTATATCPRSREDDRRLLPAHALSLLRRRAIRSAGTRRTPTSGSDLRILMNRRAEDAHAVAGLGRPSSSAP